jgi:hypothetical protein
LSARIILTVSAEHARLFTFMCKLLGHLVKPGRNRCQSLGMFILNRRQHRLTRSPCQQRRHQGSQERCAQDQADTRPVQDSTANDRINLIYEHQDQADHGSHRNGRHASVPNSSVRQCVHTAKPQ